MHTEDFITLTAPLRAVGGGRVWSLMISLFGDLAQEDGTAISGPVLSAMMSLLLVKPEAARVALHRLRNDGWIASQKSGRISQHRLTAKGRSESAAASPRIYAAPGDSSDNWQLVLLERTDMQTPASMAAQGFTALMPRVYLGPADAKTPAQALSMPGQTPPDWLRAQAQPAALTTPYVDLNKALTDLKQRLSGSETLTGLQISVLRGLIVHNWRRLILRHPALPTPLIDPEWPGHQCHIQVADLLARFPRPALQDISAEIVS